MRKWISLSTGLSFNSRESNLINHGSRTIRGRMDMRPSQVKVYKGKRECFWFATIVVTHWVYKSRYSCLQGSWVGSTDLRKRMRQIAMSGYGSGLDSPAIWVANYGLKGEFDSCAKIRFNPRKRNLMLS